MFTFSSAVSEEGIAYQHGWSLSELMNHSGWRGDGRDSFSGFS